MITDPNASEWSVLKCLAETLPVKPMSSNCECDSRRHDKTRPIVHPDGWLITCLACGAKWVEWAVRDVGRRVRT